MALGDDSRQRPAHALPPGQQTVADFRVIDLGVQPAFDPERWRLEVSGLVQTSVRLSWREFLALPLVERLRDFHCVEGWTVPECRWAGVLLRTLAEQAGVKPDAQFVFVECQDGYSTNMPLAVAMDDDVLLAHRLNGQPLAREYGGPVRLVVPSKYAYKSAKWVSRIELLAEDRLGYWEQRGYSNTADPWRNDRRAPPLGSEL